MNVKVFESTTSKAVLKATELANSVRQNVRRIPLRNEDGTLDGTYLNFESTDVTRVEEGVAQIALEFTKEYSFVRE